LSRRYFYVESAKINITCCSLGSIKFKYGLKTSFCALS
jgi:hypothetical protein